MKETWLVFKIDEWDKYAAAINKYDEYVISVRCCKIGNHITKMRVRIDDQRIVNKIKKEFKI